MSFKLRYLWRYDGTIDRGQYALIGVLGFAIKHNLDRLVAALVFHRRWGIFNYWIPPAKLIPITALPPTDIRFLVTLVAMSLPFIWVGVALTIQRLRSIGLPAWLLVFFFFPFINLLFFLLLSILPSREAGGEAKGSPQVLPRSFLDRLIPSSAWGSAAMAVVITVLLGAFAAFFSTKLLATYGWGLFVALPFCLGLGSTLLHGYHEPRSFGSCLGVASLSAILLGVLLLLVAMEGVVCLFMALPIGLPLAIMGGSVGWAIQRRPAIAHATPSLMILIMLYAPGLMSAERAAGAAAPVFVVRTAIEVNAAPQEVWKWVVSFSDIPEPKEWVFRTGVAYPIHAKITGRGTGAVRYCTFSTGSFVEPIQVWDEPRLLRFSVTANPPPMEEWSPYRTIQPPHLHGFLVSRQGQFLLTPLPGGRTLLEGTTWYQHNFWPAEYWRLWSDTIIHHIHLRVLSHVKRLAESQGPRLETR